MITYTLGIDPGPEKSAYILLSITDNKLVDIVDKNHVDNKDMKRTILSKHILYPKLEIAIETIVSYGMCLGKTTINTAIWVGRYYQLVEDLGRTPTLIERPEVKLNLCHSKRAKDKNLTQALKDRFGSLGTKKKPGRLYNLKGGPKGAMGHIWSALSVAITYLDLRYGEVK